MDFYTVVDTAAFIWDREQSQANDSRYYALSLLIVDFLKIMEVEKPRLFLRNELKDHIFAEFPWDSQDYPNFWEVCRTVAAFLGNTESVPFNASDIDDTTSNPNIVYQYYSDSVKTEIGYLIREMHSSESNIKYFTFCPIWNLGDQLVTNKEQTDKAYDTIVQCEHELQTFLEGLRPKFVHSPKHDRLIRRVDIERGYRLMDGKKRYPFSANYSAKPNYAQNLLELSITHHLESDKAYYFDEDNHTYVCFMHTEGRVYHGFDVPEHEIHEPIRTAVMMKFNEQNNN